MAQYARTTTIDVNPGGDSGKQGFIDLDTDLTGIVAAYNAHDTATTSVHGFTGTKTGSGAMVGATSPTLITPLIDHIDEATSAHGVVIDGVTLKDGGALVITGGTNTFNITNGTASLDVATGKTVNIDDDVTVAAELHVEAATHVNQDLTSDASPTFAAIKLTTGAGEGKILTSSAHGVVIDGVTLKDGGALVITGGTNTFNLANGTASLDVAAGKTVDIDDDVTVAAELHVEAATHLNQDLTSDASPTFAAIKLTSGAGAGKILTSDGSGNASWADAPSSGGDFLVMQVFS